MQITQYQHGDPELFRLLGGYFCNREVHKELGEAIYSGEGTLWFVATEDGQVVGFCSMSNTKKGTFYGYAYVEKSQRGKGIFSKLSDARDKAAVGVSVKVVVKEARWHHYEKRGWTVASRRGSWVYGVRG